MGCPALRAGHSHVIFQHSGFHQIGLFNFGASATVVRVACVVCLALLMLVPRLLVLPPLVPRLPRVSLTSALLGRHARHQALHVRHHVRGAAAEFIGAIDIGIHAIGTVTIMVKMSDEPCKRLTF